MVVVGSPLADHRGQIMKRLTSAQLFAPPKRARKTKARLERAKLVVVAAPSAFVGERSGRIVEGCAAYCCAVPAARSRAATTTNLARSSTSS